MSKRTVCFYHDPCIDGFTSAWIVSKFHPDAEFIPVGHKKESWPQPPQNALVYVADFTFDDMEYMSTLIELNDKVVHLDHHATAKTIVDDLALKYDHSDYECAFDTAHSGAGLTFRYFFPNKEKPYLISRVEDRDLWNFKYNDTKAFCEGLRGMSRTFEEWDRADNAQNQKELLVFGAQMLQTLRERCQYLIDTTSLQTWIEMPDQTYRTVVFSRAQGPGDFSEQANMMLDSRRFGDIVGAYTHRKDGQVLFLIATRTDGPHAGDICAHFGGGGHANVGGFDKSYNELKDNNQGLGMVATFIQRSTNS